MMVALTTNLINLYSIKRSANLFKESNNFFAQHNKDNEL